MELSNQIAEMDYNYLIYVDATDYIALDYNGSLNKFINDNFDDLTPFEISQLSAIDIEDKIYDDINEDFEVSDTSEIQQCIEEIENAYGDTYDFEEVEDFILNNREIKGIKDLPIIISGYISDTSLKDVYTQQGYELNDILTDTNNPFNKGITKRLDSEHKNAYDLSYFYKELTNEPQIYIVEKMTLDEKINIFESEKPNIEINKIFVYMEEPHFARGYYVELEKPLIVAKDDILISYDIPSGTSIDTPLELAYSDLADHTTMKSTDKDVSSKSTKYTKEELEQVLNMGGIIDYNRGTGSLTVNESLSKNKQQDLDI